MGKTLVVKKLQEHTFIDIVPYSGCPSLIKPSCSKTELNHCTTTEIHRNTNEYSQTSLVVSTIRLPDLHKNWRASLLIVPWDSTAIWTNSPCDNSPAYLTTLLDAANSAAAPASWDEASRYELAVVQDTMTSHMRDQPMRHGISVKLSTCLWTPGRQLRQEILLWHHWDGGALQFCLELTYIQDCVSRKSQLVNHNVTEVESQPDFNR